MSILKIKDLVHKYVTYGDTEEDKQEIAAINHIDINVEKGEFVAILGKNGSGKSSLAKHINGLLMPTEGTVYIKGMDTKDESTLLKVRQSAGIVFQNPDNQIVGTTVEEDTAFGPENLGIASKDIWTRITAALTGVGMIAYKEASPNHLSGGQKQRVAIAGIMAMRPKCIILDEATAMLDPVGRKKVLDTVHKLNRDEKITIIMITHYMEEAADADYIYVMNHGKVRMEGTPREVFVQKEKLEECRLELPEISQIANGLRERGIMVPADVLTQEELVDALLKIKE